MSKIIKLGIKNFHGIKSLSQDFDKDFVCLVGRCDSGKTTILDAISYVLSPSYIIPFYDTDFFNANIENPIEIEATLSDIPELLQTEDKFGLYKRQYNPVTKAINDNIEENQELLDVWTIKLTVDKNLDPKWELIKTIQEPKPITATDRAKLNCFLVADYVDRHFSWNRGTPLYQLLKSISPDANSQNIIIDALRDVKSQIDGVGFHYTDKATSEIKKQAAILGLDINNAKTSIDFKDIALKDDKVCLNDANNIPFRLRGKGTKRIVSMAIQLALSRQGGIVLIDEIEQGLEPDRIKQIVSALKDENKGQIFITTHSREAIVELVVDDLMLVKKSDDNESVVLNPLPNRVELQKVVRACPEGFFAKKVIVCEGKTEIGICRSLDKWRQRNKHITSAASKDCCYVLGEGNTFVERVKEIKSCGFMTCVFLDSDEEVANTQKDTLRGLGIDVFDWEPGNSIEKQVFKDLPISAIEVLVNQQRCTDIPHITDDSRIVIATRAETGKWYKQIGKGEVLGDVIFENWDSLTDNCQLKIKLKAISDWIDT